MSNILTWSYWLSLSARELDPRVKTGLLIAFAALIALGLLARFVAAKKEGDMFWAEGGKRFSSMALWMGFLGLFFLWCTHELTYFFGARFWYLVWTAGALAWSIVILRFMIAVVPKKKAEYAEKARIRKWLPKN